MLAKMQLKGTTTLDTLTRYFIEVNVGDRILTISDFGDQIPVSRGTIQNSLQILKDMKAIELESRGKFGTYLIAKDIDALLSFTNINFLIGAMPLPYSKLYEGLATGILNTLEGSLKIPVNIAHMRGAKNRIELVRKHRYDFAVVSKFAALHYQKENPDTIDIVSSFGIATYVKKHVLLKRKVVEISDKKGIKVGIDPMSLDQYYLTKNFFKDLKVEYITINYAQIIDLLEEEKIDFAIWNGDELNFNRNKIDVIDIEDKTGSNFDNTEAVIIISCEKSEIGSLIKTFMNKETVLRIQEEVVNGIVLPQY